MRTRQRVTTHGLLLAVLVCATAASAQDHPLDPRSSDLARLIQAQGVSGFETDARDAVVRLLPAWVRSRVDEIGNLIVTIGQGRPHLLVITSLDEDGYVVSGITDEGYLRVQRVTGGINHRMFEQFHFGQPVVIRTTRGLLVHGVFITPSQHLLRRDTITTPRGLDDLWIDVGAENRTDVDKLGIQMLDTVSLRERCQVLAGGRVAGVAAQARGGALALVNLLGAYGAAPSITGTLTLAWTAQGQFGERGLARLAQQVDPDRVVALTRAAIGKEPDPAGAAGRIGGGPLALETDSAIQDLARQQNIPVQVVGGLRVPNAWQQKTQVLSLPVLFAQTPVETVDVHDVAALTALVSRVAGLPSGGAIAAARDQQGQAGTTAAALPDRAPAIFRSLRPLVEAYGVSGHEASVREAVVRQLPKWAKPEVDTRGNLTVSAGQGGKEMMFVAHLDEIGYEIVSVQDAGTATVRKLGGFLDMILEAHPVLVHTARGIVPAIVAPRPNYLRAAEAFPRPEDVVLYFGTTTRADTEALGVAKGDTATVRKMLAPLAGERATARSLDDRCGVAALVAAMNRIDPAKLPSRVTFVFTVAEETGLAGAAFVAARQHPAAVFAVDTFVSSDSPVDPQRLAHIPLGSGAVVRGMDSSVITPPAAVARLAEIARAHKIPVTVGTTQGGNDGSMFTRYGSVVMPISWPGRYSHSPVEVVDARDLGALVDFIVALAHDF